MVSFDGWVTHMLDGKDCAVFDCRRDDCRDDRRQVGFTRESGVRCFHNLPMSSHIL